MNKIEKFYKLVRKAIYFAWHRHHFLIPPAALKKYAKSFFNILRRSNSLADFSTDPESYIKWIKENEKDFEHKDFKYKPLISVVIPTYNVSRKLLSECLDSILNQSYQNFEICIADDHSPNEETIETLKEYSEKYEKIKVTYRKENGRISKATNTAIEMAKGEFIMLCDNDDVMSPDAMYFMVEALNEDKTLDFIYSDEDKLDFNGRRIDPYFKPDYSPHYLLSANYICHLTMIRKKYIDDVGGFNSKYDGAQDWDLFLKVLDKTKRVKHIPKILYHWRMSETSTAGGIGNKPYVVEASKNTIYDWLKRNDLKGTVELNPNCYNYLTNIEHNIQLVSIIIPTRNYGKLVKNCVDSLYEKNSYKNFEIILVDNDSDEKESIDLFKKYENEKDNFHIVKAPGEFNYSKINNIGAKAAKGEYLLLLNNDTLVKESDFIDKMLGYAQLPFSGCVGIKLLYDDEKVQHAGVALGYGGLAGHIFVSYSKSDCGPYGRLCTPFNYSAVTAACLMIKKSKFEEVGGFDEKLKVALNDVDLNLKVLDKGYYNVCMSNVTMYHLESKSRGYEVSKEKAERFKKECDYLENKWKGKIDFKDDKYFSKYNF